MSTRVNFHLVSKLKIISGLLRIFMITLLILLISPITPVRADTSVCGPITTDTTWTTAGNNYVVTCLVHVMSGVTLTIEPGVRVYFNLGTSLRIDGELIVQGVTFMTNDPTPARGDWGHILFTTTSVDAVFDPQGNYVSGSILKDSVIGFGGGGAGVNGAVDIISASPYVAQNTILENSTRGIYAIGRSIDQKVVISENSITNNGGEGIYVSVGQVISNTIQGNSGRGVYSTSSEIVGNTITTNSGGGIYADSSDITGNAVSGNSAVSSGGGILAIGGTVQGNIVTGNSAHPDNWEYVCGGGIYASAATISDNVVDGNQVNGGFFTPNLGGAGVCAYLSVLTNNTITNNTAAIQTTNTFGGGVYSEGSNVSHNQVSGNSVTGNSEGYGGGIYAKGGTVSENTISDNVASGGNDSKGGGVYGDISTIQENTLTGNSANQGGAVYAYKGSLTSNNILTNTTSLTGTLYIDQGTATLNTLKGNTAVAGGAIYGSKATLTGNTIQDNAANYGAGIYAEDSTVRGNTLSGNDATSDGGGIHASGGEVTYNTLTDNSVPSWGHGSGAYIVGVADFSNNDVLTNTAPGGTSGGVSVSGQPVLQYNNLYGNQPYDAEVVSSGVVSGTLNYWGLSNCTSIPGQIYDGNDAPGRGTLTYAPSLYLPVPVAQLAAPTDLMIDISETAVTLNWTPILGIPNIGCRVPGSDAPEVGYRVYYGGDPCAPFDGKGLPQGDSPIDVMENTTITISEFPGQATYFSITAYDYLGRESHYTNVVGTVAEGYRVYLPITRK